MDTPPVIDAADVEAWSATTGVLVVGCGAAGASVAIEARASGAKVTILERGTEGGGATALSGGHIYLGGGTPVQEAAGFVDSPAQMYTYLTAVSPDADPVKIRRYCDDSVEHFHWLEANGVGFDRSYYPGKHVLQPGRECLIWTGNENVWPFRDLAKPVPRGHKVAAEGDGGRYIMRGLTASARAAGARLDTQVDVTALVVDAGGEVVGVRAQRGDATSYVRARRGVVLAGGGFVMNAEMVREFVPVLAESVYPLGAPSDDGTAIGLGVSMGGAVAHMDGAFLSATNYPPESLLKAIIVNSDGERFVAEDSYHGRTASFVAEQRDGVAYLILDDATFAQPEFKTLPFIDGWESIAAMEAALHVPVGSLARTLEGYNEHAARGRDPTFHKASEWLAPLVPPYAAFDLSIGKAAYCGFTLGGLVTSVDGEVLDGNGDPLPGLYAVGACASNIVQDGQGYCSGTSIGEATLFGRYAGRHAAHRQAGRGRTRRVE
jgi:3-oxo-5alpha-steroid 4-dehydrogenase